MYSTIGKKIKWLAKSIGILGIIGSITYAIFLFALYDGEAALYGWVVLVTGPVVSWLLSLPLYGFGELVDKICCIERNTRVSVQLKTDLYRMEKLDSLLEKGLITKEEYKAAVMSYINSGDRE